MGTVAFGASLCTFIQIPRAVWSSRKEWWINIRKKPITLVCLFIIIFHMTTNALISCALRGRGFNQSVKDAQKVLIANPYKFVATRLVSFNDVFNFPELNFYYRFRYMITAVFYFHR